MKYELIEYNYLTGRVRSLELADSLMSLSWQGCDALNTYTVERNSVIIVEFEGCDVLAARSWLLEHPDYDGSAGCKAWKGICAWCGEELVDGKCDCADYDERVR